MHPYLIKTHLLQLNTEYSFIWLNQQGDSIKCSKYTLRKFLWYHAVNLASACCQTHGLLIKLKLMDCSNRTNYHHYQLEWILLSHYKGFQWYSGKRIIPFNASLFVSSEFWESGILHELQNLTHQWPFTCNKSPC